MRMTLHYLAMMIIIPIYGVQVCPFIESISPIEVFVTIDSFLLLGFLARKPLITRFVDPTPLAGQARRVLSLELAVFIICGLLFSLSNVILNDFPFASGMKVLVGIVAMGLFACTDSALERERLIAKKVENEGLILKITREFFPLTSKLALYAGFYALFIVGVFSLLIIKDMDWLVTVGSEISLQDARISILKEFGFVLVVVIVEAINIILSFARNLNLFLVRENDALIKVASGSYETQVPISSNDEFGVMAEHTNEMIKRIRERTHELDRTRDVTILTLASLAETRDNETGAHILRTQRYVRALARHLSTQPQYSNVLNEQSIDLLYKSAPLHDIGKVGIPDAILLKPGKLTQSEFEVMKRHAQIGANALKIAEDQLGTNSFLRLAQEISLTHHEKWDGSGYPSALCGEQIPLSGRLMAVADVYDALISKRVYKPAFSHNKSMEIIREGCGKHFDPNIIDALNSIEAQFIEIADKFKDENNNGHIIKAGQGVG